MVTPQLGVTVISSVKKKLIKLFCFVLFFSFWRCFPWSLPVGGGWGGGGWGGGERGEEDIYCRI